jgi:hypothetical protein
VCQVYAKTLIPGTRPIPALMATGSQADVLRQQLLERGWVRFGEPLQPAAAGEPRIGVDRLQVVIDGDVVLDDDGNPASPEGWWAAVDTLGGHCIGVMIATAPSASPSLRPATSWSPSRTPTTPVHRAARDHQPDRVREQVF